jgi:hypothetical protein
VIIADQGALDRQFEIEFSVVELGLINTFDAE